MSNRQYVIEFLRSITPSDASNAEIVSRTMIKPHQQVFQITQALMKEGQVEGRLFGKEWRFRAIVVPSIPTSSGDLKTKILRKASSLQPVATAKSPTSASNAISFKEQAYYDRIASRDTELRKFLGANSPVTAPDAQT